MAIATAWDAATSDSEAEVQLIMAMISMVQNMIDKAIAEDEIDADAAQVLFRGTVRVLTVSPLDGAVRQGRGLGQGNVYWTVIYMEKAEVFIEISRAVAAARQTSPNTEGFSIDTRIEEEFQKAAAIKWTN